VLVLVRHGQTDANRCGLLLGRADPPLCAGGREQAEALARALPAPSRLISSPLARARETADALAAASGTVVEIDPRWVEMDYGALDGRPASALDADGWRTWRDDPAHVPAGGESLAAILGGKVTAGSSEGRASRARRARANPSASSGAAPMLRARLIDSSSASAAFSRWPVAQPTSASRSRA